MIIVYEADGIYENCDSVRKLAKRVLRSYAKGCPPEHQVHCVYANIPSSYFSNMYVRFRPTPNLMEYLEKQQKEGVNYFLLYSEEDNDIPADLVTTIGKAMEYAPGGQIQATDIANMVYLELLPGQLTAIHDFAEFELKTQAIPGVYDIEVPQIDGGWIRQIPMKNFFHASYYECFDCSLRRPFGEFTFVDVGYSEPIPGFGYIVDSDFFGDIESSLKMEWTIQLTGLPGEDKNEPHIINGWETDLSFWNVCFLSSLYCTIMKKLYPKSDIRLTFLDRRKYHSLPPVEMPYNREDPSYDLLYEVALNWRIRR